VDASAGETAAPFSSDTPEPSSQEDADSPWAAGMGLRVCRDDSTKDCPASEPGAECSCYQESRCCNVCSGLIADVEG
jgi:hypothetical protein